MTGLERRHLAHRPGGDRRSTPLAPTLGRPWLGISVVQRAERQSVHGAGRVAGGQATRRPRSAGYQARWSVDGGSWARRGPRSGRARARPATVHRRPRLRVQVRAKDAAGNWSGWSQAGPYEADLVQDSSTSLSKSGTWRVSRSGSCYRAARRATRRPQGASLGRTFTGRAIASVAPTGPKRGAARVYIDGNLATTIHLSAKRLHPRRMVFTRTWKTTATHSIRVVGLGTPHHRRVDVDAFVILRVAPGAPIASARRACGRVVWSAVRSAGRRREPPRTTLRRAGRSTPWHARCGRGPSSSASSPSR